MVLTRGQALSSWFKKVHKQGGHINKIPKNTPKYHLMVRYSFGLETPPSYFDIELLISSLVFWIYIRLAYRAVIILLLYLLYVILRFATYVLLCFC